MKNLIFNQIVGTLMVFFLFVVFILAAIITKETIWILSSTILGILFLLFALNSIKVIKKEKGIKHKYNFNYGLCIGFVVLATMFGSSLALFITNISYRVNGIETTAIVYDINKETNYKIEYDGNGNSYEKKKEKCDVYIKYNVDNQEYNTKLNAGGCHYSKGDKIKIYYDKDNPSKIESNLILVLGLALLITGLGFGLFIVKCIKLFSKTKNKKRKEVKKDEK